MNVAIKSTPSNTLDLVVLFEQASMASSNERCRVVVRIRPCNENDCGEEMQIGNDGKSIQLTGPFLQARQFQ